ncbi:hypothetical protein D1AOALGA4SA_100 [Olavius algarvensis Delta 1 endosymbiont]|nr:hypothetical protein D1AOALGA4SA_100 [Olavius algarvensis Delta 1 endosymbiont]
MTSMSSENIIVNLVKQAAESEGCLIEEVDFDNLTIKLNGPDEVVSDCARAVAEVLD